MNKKLSFDAKEKIVQLAGACFWYWNGFYSFLHSCGVPRQITQRYPRTAYSKYDVTRNVLDDLERAGKIDVMNEIVSGFYRMRGPVDKDNVDVKKAVSLLNEFREIVGTDPIEAEIQRQKQQEAKASYEQSVEQYRGRTERLSKLNQRFMEMHDPQNCSPQARGFALEDLFFDLLAHHEMEYRRPYRTTGEQIDGHFRYEKFDYLVETKWEQGVTKQEDLSIFDGKIRGKAQSTRGFFLSANGFDPNAITKYSGDSPRIILMTGEDLALVLSGQIPFDDALKAKIDAIVRKGMIHFPLRSIAA